MIHLNHNFYTTYTANIASAVVVEEVCWLLSKSGIGDGWWRNFQNCRFHEMNLSKSYPFFSTGSDPVKTSHSNQFQIGFENLCWSRTEWLTDWVVFSIPPHNSQPAALSGGSQSPKFVPWDQTRGLQGKEHWTPLSSQKKSARLSSLVLFCVVNS